MYCILIFSFIKSYRNLRNYSKSTVDYFFVNQLACIFDADLASLQSSVSRSWHHTILCDERPREPSGWLFPRSDVTISYPDSTRAAALNLTC